MTRKIKFRGYDKIGNKGWVYGDLVHGKGISKDPNVCLYDRLMVGGYEVYGDSVGQYTGFKDKNGKEIYEGDIIEVIEQGRERDERTRILTVEWIVDKFMGMISPESGWHLSRLFKQDFEVEVVGTAYEEIRECNEMFRHTKV